MGSWPTLRAGDVARVLASNAGPSSGSGSTAIMTSARGAPTSIDCSPLTATPIGTRESGRSHSFAESTR